MSNIVTDTHALGREMQKARIRSCYHQPVVQEIKNDVVKAHVPAPQKITEDRLIKANRDIDTVLKSLRSGKSKVISKPLEKVLFEYDPSIPICTKQIDDKLSKAVDNGVISDENYLYFIETRNMMKAVASKFKNGMLSKKEYDQAIGKTNEMLALINQGINLIKIN